MLANCPCAPGCTITVDLVLRSSGSILIGAHSTMLANGTEGFPLVDMVEAADEPIDCTEDTTTLETLLKLLYDCDLPKVAVLQELTPVELVKVGHAANKYGARAIANDCVVVIRAKEMPWPAMVYGLRYNDSWMMNNAAPHTIALNERHNLEALNNMAARAWYMYREQYLALVSSILTTPPVHINCKRKQHNCGGWGTYVDDAIGHASSTPIDTLIFQVAVDGPHVVFPLSNWSDYRPFNPSYGATCKTCNKRAKAWQRGMYAAMSMDGWRSFSQILQGLAE